MKDLIQMFQQFPLKNNNSSEKNKNKELKQLINDNKNSLNRITKIYHQIIEYLFTNNILFMYAANKNELFTAVETENSKLVIFLTQKSVNQNGLLFIFK